MSRYFAAHPGLDSFLEAVAADFGLVQALGGNVSVKLGGRMAVKSSGKSMGSFGQQDFLHEVSIFGDKPIDDIPGQSTRPSIEVTLHALLPEPLVLHLHSTLGVAISLLASVDEGLAEEVSARGVTRLPYLRPGNQLTEGVREAIAGDNLYLLSNHGLLLAAGSVSELEDKLYSFEGWSRGLLGELRFPRISPIGDRVRFSQEHRSRLQWHSQMNWRVSPDHCVFLGHEPDDETLQVIECAASSDDVFRFRPVGESTSAVAEQLACFLDLASLLPLSIFPTLSRAEALALTGWEAENFRLRQVSKVK